MNEMVIEGAGKSVRDIRDILAKAEAYTVVRFRGTFDLRVEQDGKMLIGRSAYARLIELNAPHLTLDGSEAVFELSASALASNTVLFFLSPGAAGAVIRNMRLQIRYRGEPTQKVLAGIYNIAYGVTIERCEINMASETEVFLAAVYNNGNLDTHMDTRADNLLLENNRIEVHCMPELPAAEVVCTGFRNELANSVSVSNNYIFVRVKGCGENQRAVGIHNSGRFLRISNNNVKANGTHNKGLELEQTTAVAVKNEGLYALISDNNIVSEWAGTAVALWNTAEFCKVTGNKILATHTIKGRCVRNSGPRSIFSGNIFTSTSRNARLVENTESLVLITGNMMQVLLGIADQQSCVGIYLKDCSRVTASDNVVMDTLTCGLYTQNAHVYSSGNVYELSNQPHPRPTASETDTALRRALDEDAISSLREDGEG